MWLILGGLLVFITLALWWLFNLANWLTILIISVIVAVVGGIYLFRFIAGRRAASKLEKALAQQGAQQAMNARPERRAEIQELQKQLQGGINSLKTSKLGRGGKSGAAALYTMPWYMIVGPPGAGKTTALKHSGLVFPYSSGSGGGVRGVGGTRNCDWWFTNEAILLDTAGRYTTEQDDRDEWLSFLQFLLKYRNKRPINGVLIAISITDIIDATEAQIEVTGKKLRARIDEVMTQLKMVVPVYVLFTKIDLIAGFNEFFGDLRKSDRSQAWGTTIKLDVPKNEPAKLFDAEFDILLKTLHGRGLKRLANERSREAREKIFQFPLEFAGIKKNLSELISYTFAVNAFQGTPIFRGFYFTSGTQEGRPLDRVLGRMGQAMGIRHEAQQQQQVVESKSYFLHDVFMNIVFPDGDLAARSAGEVRRQWLMRVAISASALALACILAIPGVMSALKNHALVLDTQDRVAKVTKVNWHDDKASNERFPLLKPTLDRLQELDGYRGHVPLALGWWMYQGDKVYKPALKVYVDSLNEGFVTDTKSKLEEILARVDDNADTYNANRNALKMYLMLTDQDEGHPHLDVDWATGRFTALWVDLLQGSSGVGAEKLRELARPHVQYYFTLLKNGEIKAPERKDEIVEQVRTTLQKVPVKDRYYAQFVGSLSEEKYDEAGDNSLENLVFPPVSLNDMFIDKPKLKTMIVSKRMEKEKKFKEVEGPYTEKGHAVVIMQIKGAEELLKEEAWVVPLTRDEQPDQIPVHLKRLAEDYQSNFIEQWKSFFADIEVKSPTTIDEALDLLNELKTSPYPYRRLLEKLRDNTQWKNANPLANRAGTTRFLNEKLNQKLMAKTGGLRFGVDISQINGELSFVPGKFESAVKFATGTGETDVQRYTEILGKLINTINELKRQNAQLDIRAIDQQMADARKEADALLIPYDEMAKTLIAPLLDAPLTAGTRASGAPQQGPVPPPGQAPPPTNSANGWQMPKIPGRP